jgi:hypothetical protein
MIFHTAQRRLIGPNANTRRRSRRGGRISLPLRGLLRCMSPLVADFVAEVGEERARCALAPTATHSVRAVALRGLR